MQRSLLLSGLLSRESAMKAATMQVFCSMEGVGLSLLNDKPVEVLYCSVHRYVHVRTHVHTYVCTLPSTVLLLFG